MKNEELRMKNEEQVLGTWYLVLGTSSHQWGMEFGSLIKSTRFSPGWGGDPVVAPKAARPPATLHRPPGGRASDLFMGTCT